jgi:hypothetical protein
MDTGEYQPGTWKGYGAVSGSASDDMITDRPPPYWAKKERANMAFET